jgi:hypothetical protein
MGVVRIAVAALALISGAAFLLLGMVRYRLPYDEGGRYFDPQQMVVYDVQSAELFMIGGGGSGALGLCVLFVRHRRAPHFQA